MHEIYSNCFQKIININYLPVSGVVVTVDLCPSRRGVGKSETREELARGETLPLARAPRTSRVAQHRAPYITLAPARTLVRGNHNPRHKVSNFFTYNRLKSSCIILPCLRHRGPTDFWPKLSLKLVVANVIHSEHCL